MRFNKLDLNLLVALDAMLTERGISRAAERLHMSQSAMSNALARLRDYFGDELLVPMGRKMALTPQAELLREAVRDVLLRVDTTIAARPRFDPGTAECEFKLLVSDYSVVTLLPPLLALAHAQAPGVSFQLMPQVAQQQRALERGEVDLLVIPLAYCSPDHPTQALFEEAFCCVVWNQSRLARQPLTLAAYAAAGHVVTQPPGLAQQSFETGLVAAQGLARRVEVTTHSFAAAPHLVVGTERIATVHRRLAERAQRQLPITLLAPPMPLQPMVQAMQWHKYRTPDPGLAWLRGLLPLAVLGMDETLAKLGASLPATNPTATSADVPAAAPAAAAAADPRP